MNIAYIVNARIPTEKAHGFQIAKMCEELARAGARVVLYVPKRNNPIEKDAFDYYSLERNFEIQYVPCLDTVRFSRFFGSVAFKAQTWLFLWALRKERVGEDAIVYTRNPEIALEYSKRGHQVFYDAHNFPEKGAANLLHKLRGVSGVVCNSLGTADEFKARGFERLLVAPNGVDIGEFDIAIEKARAREKLSWPLAARIATYVGHLYAWKGIDSVIGAAELCPDVTFAIVGGTQKDIAKYSDLISNKRLSNVILAGHRSRKEIPTCLKASDILLLPNAPVSKESERYTSPIKMFEYMASLTPIVASDLPSIREVLSAKTATFFEAGSSESLSSAIRGVLADMDVAHKRAQEARQEVERYSWKGRAEAILNFLKG